MPGQAAGLRLVPVETRTPGEFDAAFDAMRREGVGAVIVRADPMFFGQRQRLAELAVASRLPAIFERREYAEAGGLLAYGPSLREQFHRAATYVDKILKGAKPADLPVEPPAKLELVVNLRTAKALGLPALYRRKASLLDAAGRMRQIATTPAASARTTKPNAGR